MPRAFSAGDKELIEAERLIRDRMVGLNLDLLSLAAVSNVFRTATVLRNHMERDVLRRHQLSWSAFVVLFVLRIWGSQESRSLAAEAGISGGTLSGVLDTRERKGLVERKAIPEDRRRVEVVLTAAGMKVVDEVMPALNREEALVTGGLTADEPAALARGGAEADGQRWSARRECGSAGVANVAAAVSGSFPVGGSFSRSSLNRLAGARTRWSGLVTGATVLAFLPFADVLAPLPRATLGGVVIAAVVGLVKPRQLLGMARSSQSNAVVAWVTFCATLALSPRVEQGVLVGILVSLAVGLRRRRP